MSDHCQAFDAKNVYRPEVILTPEDPGKNLAKCEDWFEPIVLTAYHTGPRRGDLPGEDARYGGGWTVATAASAPSGTDYGRQWLA